MASVLSSHLRHRPRLRRNPNDRRRASPERLAGPDEDRSNDVFGTGKNDAGTANHYWLGGVRPCSPSSNRPNAGPLSTVPPNFQSALTRGDPVTLQLLLYGPQAMQAVLAEAYTREIVAGLSQEAAMRRLGLLPDPRRTSPFQSESRRAVFHGVLIDSSSEKKVEASACRYGSDMRFMKSA